MKKLILSLLVLLPFASNAQLVLTGNDINPNFGTSYEYDIISAFNVGADGNGVTWDFSDVVVNGSAGVSVAVDPATTANGAQFPESNIALDASGSIVYTHVNDDHYRQVGVDIPSIFMTYTDPEDSYVFPWQLGNTWTDTWASSYELGGTVFNRTGVTTGEVLGEGTLMVPGATYNQALKVHIHQVFEDNYTLQGIDFDFEYDQNVYIWVVPGVQGQIISYTSLVTDGGAPQVYCTKRTEGTIQINESFVEEDANIYPNPASDVINVNLEGTTFSKPTVLLIDMNGRMVLNESTNASFDGDKMSIPVWNLPNGVYILSIQEGHQLVSKTFTVVH